MGGRCDRLLWLLYVLVACHGFERWRVASADIVCCGMLGLDIVISGNQEDREDLGAMGSVGAWCREQSYVLDRSSRAN